MSLWYEIIRETMVSLQDEESFRLNDTWIKRRRSFESMRNIMSGLNDSGRRALKELTDSEKRSTSGSRRSFGPKSPGSGRLRRDSSDSEKRSTSGSRRMRRDNSETDFLKEVANSKPSFLPQPVSRIGEESTGSLRLIPTISP